jgi:hypothetical protein
MQVQIPASFGGPRRVKVLVRFPAAMRETVFGGALFRMLAIGSLANRPKIDDVGHV